MSQDFRGYIRIDIDKNALSVRLHFTPDNKGETHNLDTVRKLLQDNKIQYGISEIALKDAVEDFSESLEEILSDPVAEGDEPNSGKGDVYAFSPAGLSFEP